MRGIVPLGALPMVLTAAAPARAIVPPSRCSRGVNVFFAIKR
jgi:hypothetical protein